MGVMQPEGYKESPVGILPVDWEYTTISKLCNVKRGASPRPISDPKWFGGEVGWVRISDVTQANKYLKTTVDFLSDAGVEKSVRINVGEVILTICATIGVPIIVDTDVCIHDGFVWFDGLSSAIDREHWYYFLCSKTEEFKSYKQIGTQGNLNTAIVGAVEFGLPPLPEQKKIAQILSTVDSKLTLIDQQIAATQTLKKGLMQKLFSVGVGTQDADGNWQPHTEFKDLELGRIPVRWQRVPLSQVAEVRTGVAKGKKGLKESIILPYLRVANVKDGYLDLDEIKTIQIEKTQYYRYALKSGDVLMTEGGDVDKLGRGDVWNGQIEHCLHQNHVFAVRCQQDVLLPKYLTSLAGSAYGKRYFMGCAKQTTNLASINSTQLKAFPVVLPAIEEQVEMAKIISTVDRKLDCLTDKKTQTQQLKKGLMQKLLTGQIRVKVA
ncbi:restriction endonuclease subunit S [Endozoicomonas sp. 8E]|uniref:restriction endonuclease subunit S n=1 Tax=Endozoicomonas sp. 8E TaxID=3035692 RepID=UPI0029393273|nr:restriction endonuclease subunit S [Endozoicomonas sp. 8E]WOG30466.1 restriction endonuclease subunit S [Endozoicomonas sp. 8E]